MRQKLVAEDLITRSMLYSDVLQKCSVPADYFQVLHTVPL